ncbi:MAG: GNAT family N-acetyltransferase [Acidobacteriota bacterium]|nr:GNAT family N-acetyltransferase [Acidobacteriota bacterium]
MDYQINLRLAAEHDVDALVSFNRAMARETEAKELAVETLTAGVRNLLRNDQYGFYVVAEASDAAGRKEVVGSLMVTYEWSDWRDAVFWWIQSVYVVPEFRRRGIYRRLYEFVKNKAAEGNVCGFRLYVEQENVAAQRTYERLVMAEAHYKMYEEMCKS